MAAHMASTGGRRTNPWRMAVWGTAAFLLLLPAVAMQFTTEVNWDGADFIAMGLLLAAACGTYELGARMSRNTAYRAAVGLAAVAGLVLVWINLAVGVIGDEGNPANLMFGGVLVVGIIGALVARFRAAGMARALVATAIAQAVVAVIAPFTAPSQPEVWVLSGFFIAVWLTSAWLFRTAARQQDLAVAS